MTASKGFTGKGTIFSIGVAGSPETFTAVAQVKTPQLSGQKASYDDITNLDSPQSGAAIVEEALPAKMSPGEIALAGIFLPGDAGQTALGSAFASQALTDFKLQLPKAPGQTTSGNLYAFSGYVQDYPAPEVSFDKTVTFKCTIKLNTLLTVTPGS
jgi:hypothetical protein